LGFVFTVLGNALCLFGSFGFLVFGVIGVAVLMVFSQVVACVLCFVAMRWWCEIKLLLGELVRIPGRLYSAIFAIGVPTVGENLAYNLSQIAIMAMLSALGAVPLATYGIVMVVLRYVFMAGVSIGSAAQFKVGYLGGSGRPARAKQRLYRYFALGSGCSVSLVLP